MSKPAQSSLLKFLSKPRFVHEVAEHYGISRKLAGFHLLKAVKSGEVLISERPVFQISRTSKGKPKRFGGFVYVFRNSPMLSDGWARFRVRDAGNLCPGTKGNVFSVRFLSKTRGLLGRGWFNRKLSVFNFGEPVKPQTATHCFETGTRLISDFDLSSKRGRLVRRRTVDQLVGRNAQFTVRGTAVSLSHAERIQLFQALSEGPLPFLDLHVRFGVSKQSVRRLVRNGLLVEMWGSKAIGVGFKLSKKGENLLKQLEAAAKYELDVSERNVIRLKHRSV